MNFTATGKALSADGFQTKYEQGKNYGMVAYGGSTKEWYEQADAFAGVVKGKTAAEVKALVAEGNKGSDEVVKAGCTVMIHEFVAAIEKAYDAATASNVTAADTLKVTAATQQTVAAAAEEKDGSNKGATTVFAAALISAG